MTDTKRLIDEVSEIIDRNNESEYNLLEVMGVSHREVYICKILASLIDPKGSHGQNDKYLKLFFKTVLNIDIEKISDPIIHIEETTEKKRRIDFYIETDKYIIPIEAKIFSGDQYRQCFDYYSYANKKSEETVKEVKMYYLTRLGNYPTKYSMDELAYDKINCISFKSDIIPFLDYCIAITNNNPRLCESLKMLREAIISFCGINENIFKLIQSKEYKNELKEIICNPNNEPNKCEQAIKNAFENIVDDIVKKYISTVRKKLGNSIKLEVYRDKELYGIAKEFNGYQSKICLIIYPEKYKEFKGKAVIGVQIWNGEEKVLNKKSNNKLDEIKNQIRNAMPKINLLNKFKYNWIYREIIDDNYNFLLFNNPENKVFDLLDTENGELDKLVDKTVDQINDLLDRINRQ